METGVGKEEKSPQGQTDPQKDVLPIDENLL